VWQSVALEFLSRYDRGTTHVGEEIMMGLLGVALGLLRFGLQDYEPPVGGGGIFAAIAGGFMLVWLIVLVLVIAGMWKIFVKAGKPGWAAIIPIYNIVVLLEIVGRPLWWLILLIIPFVNLIALIVIMNDLAKSFGKGVGFTIGLILLGFVFIPVLGFGNAKYVGAMAGK